LEEISPRLLASKNRINALFVGSETANRLRGAIPQMDIPIQALLDVVEENLRPLVQAQRLRYARAAEFDRVRGEDDDLGAIDELLHTRLRLILEMGISSPDALIDQLAATHGSHRSGCVR
jgi:hypothetical protein